jgi:uncharacterized delta-60 repeat protein
MRRRTLVTSALVGLTCLTTTLAAVAAPGDLDSDFGTGGTTITSFARGYSFAFDVAVQANDRIVVVGGAAGRFAVARFTAQGAPDTTFSGDGVLTTSFAGDDEAHGIAIQDDGKIVVVGTAGYEAIAIARYLPGGALDTTFSGDGKARTQIGFMGEDVGIQSDGRIVVMGNNYDPRRRKIDFVAVRYEPDGRRDLTFGNEGVTRVSFSRTTNTDQAWGGALDALDRIVIVGSAFNRGFGIARLLPNGRPDPNFGTNGKTTTQFGREGAEAHDVAIQTDGRPVVVGYASRNDGLDTATAVARYRLGGTLDPTFSGDGKAAISFGADSVAWGVTIDANGKIVTVGDISYEWVLARLRTDGTLDSTFSDDGLTTTNLTNVVDRAFAVTTQEAGRIVGVGSAEDDMAIAGYAGG